MTDTSSSNLRASLGQEDESELHLSNAVAAFLFESILNAERADLPLAALPELFLSVIRLVGFSFDIPLPYVRKVTGQSSSKGRLPTSDAFHRSMTLEEVFPSLAAVESSKAEGQQSALTSKVLSQGITRSAIPLYAKQQVEQHSDTLSGEWTVVGLIGDAEAYLKKVYHRREQLHSFFLNFATEHGFGSIAIEHGCKLVAAGRSVFHPDIRAFEPNKVLWRSYLREARRMYEAETLSISQQINDQVLADAFKNSRQRYAAHPEVSYAKFKERLRAAEQLYIKSQMPFLVFEDHSERDHRDGGSTGAPSLLVRPWQPILALTTPDAKNPARVPFIQHSTRGGNSFYGPLWASNSPSQGKQLVPLAGCFPVSPKSLAITNSIRTTRVAVPKLDEPAMQHYLKNYRHWAVVYQRRRKRIPFLDFECTTETMILPTRHSETTQLPVLYDAIAEAAILGAICPTPIRSETDSDALKKEHKDNDDYFHSLVVHTSPSSLRMQLVEGRDPLRLAGTIGIDQFASLHSAKATSKAGEIAVVYRDPPSLSATGVDVQLTFSEHGASPAEAEVATAVFTREATAAAHHMQQMVAKGSRRLRTHIAPSTVGVSQLLSAMALQRFEFARVSVPKPEKCNVTLHSHPVPIGVYLAPREDTSWTAANVPPLPFAHLVPNFDTLALQEVERRVGGTLSAPQDSRNRSGDKEVLSPSSLSFGLPFHKLQSYRPLPSSTEVNGSTSSATSLPVSISLTADVPPECVVLRKPYNVSTASLVRFYNLASQEVHFPNLRRLPNNHLQKNQQKGVNSARASTQMLLHTRTLAESEAPLSDCVTFKGMGVSYRPLLVLPPYATGLLPCVPLHYGRTFGAGSYVTVRARVMPLKGSANAEQIEGAAANRVAALFEDSDVRMGPHSDSSSEKLDVLTEAFHEECSEVIKMFNIAVGGVGRSNDSEHSDLRVEATVRLERGAGDGHTCLEHFEKSLLQCGWRVCGSRYHETNGTAAYQYIEGETDIKHNTDKSTKEIDKSDGSKEGDALAITKVVFVCDSTMTTRSIQLSPAPVVGNVYSANVISTVEISDHE